MKLNVLINLFVLHEYLPERRCTHTHCFWANYSSVVIEVDVFSRCRLKEVWGGGGMFDVMGERGGGLLNCACWLFYSSETFWVRTTNHKTKALSLISAIHHKFFFCLLTCHTSSYLAVNALIVHHKTGLLSSQTHHVLFVLLLHS